MTTACWVTLRHAGDLYLIGFKSEILCLLTRDRQQGSPSGSDCVPPHRTGSWSASMCLRRVFFQPPCGRGLVIEKVKRGAVWVSQKEKGQIDKYTKNE